jgi:hypothetical protein
MTVDGIPSMRKTRRCWLGMLVVKMYDSNSYFNLVYRLTREIGHDGPDIKSWS